MSHAWKERLLVAVQVGLVLAVVWVAMDVAHRIETLEDKVATQSQQIADLEQRILADEKSLKDLALFLSPLVSERREKTEAEKARREGR